MMGNFRICLYLASILLVATLVLRPAYAAGNAECRDVWLAEKCVKRLLAGKCDRPRVAENCKNTCDLCSTTSTVCPETHPFAYWRGQMCCAVPHGSDGKIWDSRRSAWDSMGCGDIGSNDTIMCPGETCSNAIVECNASDVCADGFGVCVNGFCKTMCAKGDWECRTGVCLAGDYDLRCNGSDDCYDGGADEIDGTSSDEIDCECIATWSDPTGGCSDENDNVWKCVKGKCVVIPQ